MRILMLGWEYPPHIAGGLGVACDGLTKALSKLNLDLTFVVPKVFGDEQVSHMKLVEPQLDSNIKHFSIPSYLKPYYSETEYLEKILQVEVNNDFNLHYGNDLFSEVDNYTIKVVNAFKNEKFDIIHAHDWMTYSAAGALSDLLKIPFFAHIHSLEMDRSGQGENYKIAKIEKEGLQKATHVFCVSNLTKNNIVNRYGISNNKISVVYNGINTSPTGYKAKNSNQVLFMGRITYQKGCDHLVNAAAIVLKYKPDARFVIAGSGNMLEQLKKQIEFLGIKDSFIFPGFLQGDDIINIFSESSLFVMPSVSEPFGIVALEAVNFGVPVLISRQSGVSEVLKNTIKFDFWDKEKLADCIINVLNFEELRKELVFNSQKEIKIINWDNSANQVYSKYKEIR